MNYGYVIFEDIFNLIYLQICEDIFKYVNQIIEYMLKRHSIEGRLNILTY